MIFSIRRCLTYAAMVALISPTAGAAEATLPRAWLVTKGDAQAVLVGESHVGTPVENDQYLDTVVKPSYAVADVAVMETYFGPDQMRNEAFERGVPCPDNPKGLRTERLHRAFDALISATRANHLEVPNWLESWEILPEFHFTSIYLDSLTNKSLGPAYDAAIEAHGGIGISFRLRGKNTGAKRKIGLDTLKARRSHFCSASSEDRADFTADLVLKVARLLHLKKSDPSYASLGMLSVVGGQFFAETIRCVDQAVPCSIDQVSPSRQVLLDKGWTPPYSRGTFQISIKKRTRAWVPLIATTISSHRRSFIIVGSLHLPDLKAGERVEAGLITLLRQQGFSVTRINGAGDIRATFLSPSWFDRTRSALSSL